MGTTCHIGIEEEDGTVTYIRINQDGYFSNIVPMLNQYKEAKDVKMMIQFGDLYEICDTESDVLCETEKSASTYEFINDSRYVDFVYVFTQECEWLCYSNNYFSMKELIYAK